MHKPPNGRSGPEDRKLLKTKGCTHVLNGYSQLVGGGWTDDKPQTKKITVPELNTSVLYWVMGVASLWQRGSICKHFHITAWSDIPATCKIEARKASSLYCQGRVEGLDASQMAAEYAQPTTGCWNVSQPKSPVTWIFLIGLGIEGWGMTPHCTQLSLHFKHNPPPPHPGSN